MPPAPDSEPRGAVGLSDILGRSCDRVHTNRYRAGFRRSLSGRPHVPFGREEAHEDSGTCVAGSRGVPVGCWRARGRLAPGVVKKTPLDVDTDTVYKQRPPRSTRSAVAFDRKPVFAVQQTKADSEKSSDDHVLFVETELPGLRHRWARECVNGNDPDLITAGIDIFAVDRVTAMAVEDKNLPPDAAAARASSTSGPSTWRRRPTPTGTAPSVAPSTSSTRTPRRSRGSRPTASRPPSPTSRSTWPRGSPAPTPTS